MTSVNKGSNQGLCVRPLGGAALSGTVRAPGDKSISHRALILGAMADGRSSVHGLLEGEDVLRTAAAMRAFGAEIERDITPDGPVWRIEGRAWRAPEQTLYFGNSGTGCRLVMGAAAGRGVSVGFDGDSSLRSRPMGRILEPLEAMGAKFDCGAGKLPATLQAATLSAIDYELPVASAQIKSAILLAALGADGTTCIVEPQACRDHTERMLGAFGAAISVTGNDKDSRKIEIKGRQRLQPSGIIVPGDPSSAAFMVAAAVINKGGDVIVENVLINPLRAGFFETLTEMGADLTFMNERELNGEPVADIRARYSSLRGVEVPADRAPSMIDEYPILSMVAAFASGETVMRGLKELRVKESDRIASVEAGLRVCGAETRSGEDWLKVSGGRPNGGAVIETRHDHRIAMSFLVLGLGAKDAVTIDDASMIATSFPEFIYQMQSLGADIGPVT